ncbi:Zn-dependent alcohol Dehydrogenase [Bacillus thuringiensis serovar sotto str. T04001]|nr:Zn-dependent alcohol Dehydrogenase [Bacillus thuringiensis serovar sotto str. T04001]
MDPMLRIRILFIQRKTGYESYGEVIEVGNKVTHVNVGDKVVFLWT